MTTRVSRGRAAIVRYVGSMVLMAGMAAAQPATAVSQPVGQPAGASAAVERLTLTAGRSTVLSTDFHIVRVSVTDPAIADVVVVQPTAVLVDGKSVGTISLIVWGENTRRQWDVVVDAPVSALQLRLQALFPGEDITASSNDEAIILSGRVSSNIVSSRAAEIAAATSSKSKVVNLLRLPGGTESQQVMLQVRFAEVSRRALTELGASFFTGNSGYKDWVARSSTQQFAAPTFGGQLGPAELTPSGTLTFSDFLNLFLFNSKYDIGAVIRALQTNGLFQSLAEPNLIARNGEEASFLAGGEVPVPVVQGITNAVSVQFKEFGIRLTFRPTIIGDTIRLKVKPEVSSLDFSNGIVLSGFRIPSLSTRRVETDVELRDGQSFAIAGLLNNLAQDEIDAIPGLARIPIIGRLFQSKSTRTERTELLVLITPRLVRPLEPDEVPELPVRPSRFLPPAEGIGEALEGGGGVIDGPADSSPGPGPAGTGNKNDSGRPGGSERRR